MQSTRDVCTSFDTQPRHISRYASAANPLNIFHQLEPQASPFTAGDFPQNICVFPAATVARKNSQDTPRLEMSTTSSSVIGSDATRRTRETISDAIEHRPARPFRREQRRPFGDHSKHARCRLIPSAPGRSHLSSVSASPLYALLALCLLIHSIRLFLYR